MIFGIPYFSYHEDEELLKRVPYVFLLLGGIQACMIILAGILIREPQRKSDGPDEDKENVEDGKVKTKKSKFTLQLTSTFHVDSHQHNFNFMLF